MRETIFNLIESQDKKTRFSKLYDGVMLAAIFVSLVPLMFREEIFILRAIEYTVTVLFSLDYVLRWITADIKKPKMGKWAFVVYPLTFAAIIDLVSILPIFASINNSLRILRMWRLFSLLLIFRIFRHFEPLQIVLRVFKKKSSQLLTVVGFAIVYIFITALIMFNLEKPINPATGQHFFCDFFDALYWATCTLTTVGYGDIYPLTNIGRFISMISALVGISIVALPSSIITSGYMEEMKEWKTNSIENKKYKS